MIYTLYMLKFVASLMRVGTQKFGGHSDLRERRVAEMGQEQMAAEKSKIGSTNHFCRTFYIKRKAWLGHEG